MKRCTQVITISTLAAAMAACGGGDSSDSQATGKVSVGVTDAPATEFSNVTISFTGITLKPVDGEKITFSFDEPKSWNLLTLQGGLSEPLITDEEVPAGEYSELRLLVNTEQSFLTLQSEPDV